jgi:hypothetical protein
VSKKKLPNIYIRQYQEFGKKRSAVRKPFIIALVVIIVLAAGAIAYIYKDLWIKKPQQLITIVKKETISVYFPTGKGKLVEKKIDIATNLSDKEKGNAIIRNLKAFKAIPEELTMNDLALDSDGILYLNLSKDIAVKKTATIAEITRIFSIVNSFLGNFRNASKVQLLVEGHPVYTLNGTVYTYKPLEFNQDLLED